jgi:peptide/nickel transport system substrate-binding protein
MRRLLLPVVTAAVALSLTACSGSGTSSPRADPTTSTSPSYRSSPTRSMPVDSEAKGPAVVRGALPGGVVTVLTHAGLSTTLDPAEAYQRDTLSIESSLVTRSLTQYKYDPFTKEMLLVPDLATDLGHMNDDYTKWQFTVRSGVRFEDGEKVTAKSVAWGIRRCMDATTFPTGPCQSYANALFAGGRTYRGPYTAPRQAFRSVRVKGDVVTISFERPFPDMPFLATLPAMGPVPLGKRSDPTTYRTHPLATGPYKIVSYRPGHELVLTRNSEWDARTDPARTQYPDGFDFKAGLSTHRIDRMLLADQGSARTTLTYDDVSPADYPDWSRSAARRLTLGGSPCTTYLAPDNRTIRDARIRRALSWAYPYRPVLRAEGAIPGVTAVPATNLMPPSMPGRRAHRFTARRGFHSDPSRARALLRSAGDTGYPIRFQFDSHDPVSVRVKDALVRALTASGFAPHPEPSYTGTSLPGAPPGSDVNVRTTTRCSDWPTGGQWIPPVYGTTPPTRYAGLGTNQAAFSQPAVDRRIAAIERMPLEMQPREWDRLDLGTMTRWFPLVPISYGGVDMAHGSRIRGMYDDIVRGMPTWTYLWVAP